MNPGKLGRTLAAAVALSLAGLSGVFFPLPAPAQTPPTAQEWVSRLKLAPARIEDADGKQLAPADMHLERHWSGDICASKWINTGKTPVRLGKIILCALQPHRLSGERPAG